MKNSAFALVCGLALLAGACSPARPKPPHGVLVLLVDCLRYDHVGLDGSKLPTTPAIDAAFGKASGHRVGNCFLARA